MRDADKTYYTPKEFDVIIGNPPYNNNKGSKMNIQTRNELFTGLLTECTEILSSKGLDYAGNEDANRNFKEVGRTLGMTPFQTWAVYFNKHVDAVNNAIKNNPDNPKRHAESVEESLKDIINYAGILYTLIYEYNH